jgi:hypothetical protein
VSKRCHAGASRRFSFFHYPFCSVLTAPVSSVNGYDESRQTFEFTPAATRPNNISEPVSRSSAAPSDEYAPRASVPHCAEQSFDLFRPDRQVFPID